MISVIIPTYNGAEYIKRAIDSVLNQSLKDTEVIIIDDGSVDNTREILDLYIKDKKIIYLYQENNGQNCARYHGIQVAKGEYIAFLDDDDEWIDKDKIKKQVEFLENNPDYVLVGTRAIIVDENGNKIIDWVLPQNDQEIRGRILIRDYFINSSVVVRKESLLKLGNYSLESYRAAEDYYLWLKIGLIGKFYNLPEYMTSYMIRKGNTTSKNKIKQIKEEILIINKFKNDYPRYSQALFWAYMRLFVFVILIKFKLSDAYFIVNFKSKLKKLF